MRGTDKNIEWSYYFAALVSIKCKEERNHFYKRISLHKKGKNWYRKTNEKIKNYMKFRLWTIDNSANEK